jgi:hypothetical protein
MSKVIFSLYIDIPENELDEQSAHWGSNISKTLHTKIQLKDNYKWLIESQQRYANYIGVEYKHYTYDSAYIKYKEWFNLNYPEVTSYNIVNFYKLKLLYNLAKDYDEILYLDLDVIPVSTDNFFKTWDLSQGIAIMSGTAESQKDIETDNRELLRIKYTNNSNRSPIAKYWNAKAMLLEKGYTCESTVFNTGIVGASQKWLKALDYFGDFRNIIDYMTQLKTDDGFYPEQIQSLFGYDNETIWAYKTLSKDVPWQKLTPDWHCFMDKWSYIPSNTKLVHCINKDFKYVRDWYEKNNILNLFK